MPSVTVEQQVGKAEQDLKKHQKDKKVIQPTSPLFEVSTGEGHLGDDSNPCIALNSDGGYTPTPLDGIATAVTWGVDLVTPVPPCLP